jgi:hypothetical protein
MRRTRLGRVHDAIDLARKLRRELQLLFVEEAGVARERRGFGHAPDQLRFPLAALAHEGRRDLRSRAPRLDDVGSKCFCRLGDFTERAEGKSFARQRNVVNGHAVLAQHRSRRSARRQAHDLRLDARLRHARQHGHEQRLLEGGRRAAFAHDVQHAQLSQIVFGHDDERSCLNLRKC